MQDKLEAFKRLLNIMDDLRTGCPWDKKQTLESLRPLTIEETYELADAIMDNDLDALKGEIGDIMLHMVFYSKIADEKGAFDIGDVLNTICDKLIHRHPHIYGDVEVANEEEVKANWEKLKLKEGKKSVLEGVPNSLPALVKAQRIQEKVKGVGFEWDSIEQVYAKVEEELEELKVEIQGGNQEEIEKEFGDVIFALINYGRWIGVNAENALSKTNNKFKSRFEWMENAMLQDKKNIGEMSLEEMDEYWEKSKAFFK